jgi:hypothetical protein
MAEQSCPVEAIARPLIEQCRRELAAAWAQIEAAREVLKRNRWLVERWSERSRLDELNESARLISLGRSEAARIGMFVTVEPETRRRGGRRVRTHALRKSSARSTSHSRLPSVSG